MLGWMKEGSVDCGWMDGWMDGLMNACTTGRHLERWREGWTKIWHERGNMAREVHGQRSRKTNRQCIYASPKDTQSHVSPDDG